MESSETSIAMAAWPPHPDAVLRQTGREDTAIVEHTSCADGATSEQNCSRLKQSSELFL
jgi:hypothetical protein